MEGKEVLKIVAGLKKQKNEKEKTKTDRTDRSPKGKETFYKCKKECKYEVRKCKATNLKECPNCTIF